MAKRIKIEGKTHEERVRAALDWALVEYAATLAKLAK